MPNTYPRHAPMLYLGPSISRYYCEPCDALVTEDEVEYEWQEGETVASIARHDACGNEVEYHDDVPVDDDGNELEDESEDDDEGEEGGDDDA